MMVAAVVQSIMASSVQSGSMQPSKSCSVQAGISSGRSLQSCSLPLSSVQPFGFSVSHPPRWVQGRLKQLLRAVTQSSKSSGVLSSDVQSGRLQSTMRRSLSLQISACNVLLSHGFLPGKAPVALMVSGYGASISYQHQTKERSLIFSAKMIVCKSFKGFGRTGVEASMLHPSKVSSTLISRLNPIGSRFLRGL